MKNPTFVPLHQATKAMSASPLQRHFITLAYQGTPYHGWQRQPKLPTVQETLEQALARLGYPCPVVGSGRTDAGVHAWGQQAHLDLPAGCDTAYLTRRLNALLPPTMRVLAFRAVHPTAHARYDAHHRSYHYHVGTMPSPFHSAVRYQVRTLLDWEAMNAGVTHLLGKHNFRSFCKHAHTLPHYDCHLSEAAWHPQPWGATFIIKANRFLHGMVRAIVGTLLPIGRQHTPPAHVKAVLAAHDRRQAGMAAPPHGLFLMEVGYPASLFL